MLHFALVSPPFTSHIRALEALAGELLARGHRASWLGPVAVLDAVGDRRIGRLTVGARSHPAGSLAGVVARAARPGSPLGLRRVIQDMARATGMLCSEGRQVLQAARVDAVIADPMEGAGGLLAQALGVPFVSVSCALPLNREPGVPLPVMPWGPTTDEGSLHRNEVSTRIHDWMMMPLARTLRQQSAALGAPERSSLADGLSPLLQLSQTTEAFDFPRTRLPRHFHHVGPLRPPLADEPPLGLPIEAGRPFVFASLGTLQGGRLSLFKKIARACRAIDAQLLVAHCGRLDVQQVRQLERAGADWVTDFAPQRAALARADAVVTHAGLNTVLDALAEGTPMLALPIAFDQPGVAARVVHAGAGLRLFPAWAGVGAIRRGLERLLSDPSFSQRSAALGVEVKRSGGTRRAADLVERALGIIITRATTEVEHAA